LLQLRQTVSLLSNKTISAKKRGENHHKKKSYFEFVSVSAFLPLRRCGRNGGQLFFFHRSASAPRKTSARLFLVKHFHALTEARKELKRNKRKQKKQKEKENKKKKK
jgi:hypothetical protein